MNKFRFLLITLLSLTVSMTAMAQQKQKQKLAVLDPVVVGEKLTEGLAISVREIVSSNFVNNADNYAIVERSLIEKVMQEAKFSNSDAVDESQATRLGKLAGADKVVLTVISRFDNRCMMSIKLIDVESATIDKQISKLVDMSSLLDVTEPLTLAVLGKGNDNITFPQSNQGASTSDGDGNNKKKLGNLFGLKKDKKESGKAYEATSATPNTSFNVAVPEFTGVGINYVQTLVDIDPQNDEFILENFNKLRNNRDFNVVLDLSGTLVEGIPLLKFRELKQPNDEKVFGNDFFNRMTSEMSRLMKALNSDKNMYFSYIPDASITLLVKVRVIDEPGRENTSDYVFVDNSTGEVLAGIRIKSKGGRFGSWTNLFGDALEEDAAPTFIKKFKSAKKKYDKLIK